MKFNSNERRADDMELTLRNAMRLGKFSECEVVAGHKGLSRVVKNITIMEVPEVVQWLKDKELILTSLFAIKDDLNAQNTLIQKLNTAGATALAIKPSQFIKTIPTGITESANRLGFPIVIIPDHVKYLDILSPVMHHIFNEKVVLQEEVEDATKILHELSLHDQGIGVFAENLSFLTKNKITIESEVSFIKLSTTLFKDFTPLNEGQKYELSIIQRPLQINREYENNSVSCIVAPILVDGEYFGNITSWGMPNGHLSLDLAILEKASTLLSLEFLKLKVKHSIEQQYESDFMREVLFSHNITEKNVIEWGKEHRITKDKQYVCLLFSARYQKSKNKHYEKLKDYNINDIIKKTKNDILVGYIRNGICVILPANENNLIEYYKRIFSEIKKHIGSEFNLSAGVGRKETGPIGIQKSFQQADQALYLSETMYDFDEIVFYDDLGAYRLINQLKDNQELYDFHEETIGKLISKDKNNELLHTLKEYYIQDEILKITANSLFIHVNTLKYRIKKVEEITGCDLKTSEGKMNIYLGLKIHELLKYFGN